MFVRKFSFFKVCQKLLNADGGTGGTGGTSGTGEGTGTGGIGGIGEGTGTGGTGDGTGGTGEGAGSDDNSSNKTFTQADLDRVVADRLARERKKYEGVNVEEYRQFKADLEARAEAEKSELQKAQDKIAKAELEKQQTLELANKRLILAEFKVLARDANIKYVDDAYRLADLSTVEVKEDGTIEGLKVLLESLVKDKPFLVQEVVGGTGKVDNTTKGNNNNSGTSFGARLGEKRKEEMKSDKPKNYFK